MYSSVNNVKGTLFSTTKGYWATYFGFKDFQSPGDCAAYVKALLHRNAYTIDPEVVRKCLEKTASTGKEVLPRGNYFTTRQRFFVPVIAQHFLKSMDSRDIHKFLSKRITVSLLAYVATLAHNAILVWISGTEGSGQGAGFGTRDSARRKWLTYSFGVVLFTNLFISCLR